jgi:hypothetical protein
MIPSAVQRARLIVTHCCAAPNAIAASPWTRAMATDAACRRKPRLVCKT